MSKKFIVMLLALQIMNMSVYSSGFYIKVKDGKGHKVSMFNQIDSVLEYLVEITFGQVNAFPEQDTGHHHPIKHITKTAKFFDVAIQEIRQFELQSITEHAPVKYTEYTDKYDFLYYKEINPPPPKFNLV
ncbi:hypothetical protein [Edaphocola aurantiacus]|uniref:hypothetical protein n=1 Tax=Edaphocola aurantiacus TaxID=2601682 RepID=UPI001C9829A1|nr:hypothetical protein [Edaphocola aurantiacus]